MRTAQTRAGRPELVGAIDRNRPGRFSEPPLPTDRNYWYDYSMARQMRKRMDHKAHFAGRFGAIYFITICCQRRGSNQLCHDETAAVLANTARIYHERARWNLNLLLLMPDHLHALIGVDGQTSLAQLIRDYKRITAKIAGVGWQRNFFDHRLRHDESLAEKFAYICQNPVRAGLVRTEHDWPYVFIPGQQSRR